MARQKVNSSKSRKAKRRGAYDRPWKISVQRLFPHFLAFFFPEIYELIDWTRPYKFLAQELEQISAGIEGETSLKRRGYKRGARSPLHVDLLVEVFFKDGRAGRILLHIEIQNDRDPWLEERLFIYHYRIFDKLRDDVIALVLLTDFDPDWRPSQYVRERAGCRVTLSFPARKLMDYNLEDLEKSRNPFAFIAKAHAQARETRDDDKKRYDLRLALHEAVDASGFKKREFLEVTRFIEGVMRLPEELDRKLFVERVARKEAKKMEFYTYAERVGERRGRRKGKIEGAIEAKRDWVLKLLEIRFGKPPNRVEATIKNLADQSALEELHTLAIKCRSLKSFETRLLKDYSATTAS
jgi:hypothetical protein